MSLQMSSKNLPQFILQSNPDDDILRFQLTNINVSFANSIRRTILSDIDTLVFKTLPHEENMCNIYTNTSRLNNEIIKQRLSCIPIHIDDIESFDFANYILELNVENDSDILKIVTTDDFKIKHLETNTYLDKDRTIEIFPPTFLPNNSTGYFIDFLRLRPRLSEQIPGEKIHLTCRFSVNNCKNDGMFNVVSNCSYGYTVDTDEQEIKLAEKQQTWKDEGKTDEEIQFEKDNWMLLDGFRITRPDSFDFIIETIGVYTNKSILEKACDILINRLSIIIQLSDDGKIDINDSNTTMSNCYDIRLDNEDYTIGKIIEYMFYIHYFETKVLTFSGFKKFHPHDTHSIIRLAYKKTTEKNTVHTNLKDCVNKCIHTIKSIKQQIEK